ncbi:MAG TPA: hypothetical protein VMZ11_02410 [Mycobacteriales bacterium]|nr:hypothetical protein [Mycobacteriales bacterium]
MRVRRAVIALGALAVVAATAPAQAQLTPASRSLGTVEASYSVYSTSAVGVSLTGDVSFGNRTFHGTAGGSADWYCCDGSTEPLIPLHGSSPDGDLDATCVDGLGMSDATPTAGTLVCTGHIGDGAVTTTRLVVALPIASGGSAPYHGYSYHYSGVYAG